MGRGREMTELEKCPWCKEKPQICVVDDFGVYKDREYEKNNPDCGNGYVLVHERRRDKICPIATYKEEQLGVITYNSPEQAAEAWNRREKQ
jgi:hypothetical protein